MGPEDVIELDIVDIDSKGNAYGLDRGRRIYVRYAVPGDKVRVKVSIVNRGRRSRFWGDLLEIVKFSDERVEPRCRHFGLCGGCRFQNVSYYSQLRYKRDVVRETFLKYGLDLEIDEPVPSPRIYYYRNRMDYPVGFSEGCLAVGLKVTGRWDLVVPLSECYLMSNESVEIIKRVRDFMRRRNILPYDSHKHRGFLRYVVVREGKFTGERLVSLVTAVGPFPYLDELIDSLGELSTGIIWSINPTLSDMSVGMEIRGVYGNDFLNEEIRGIRFYIHPNAFFQTNSYQTVTLLEIIEEMIGEGRFLLDVYSGVGLFALSFNDKFDKVYGIELDENSIYSAEINAKRIDSKTTFLKGSAEDLIPIISDEPDVVILDPPRPGLSKRVKDNLLVLNSKNIIYISCNPETLARDISILSKRYGVEGSVRLIDMFPHTPHIECVVHMVRRK